MAPAGSLSAAGLGIWITHGNHLQVFINPEAQGTLGQLIISRVFTNAEAMVCSCFMNFPWGTTLAYLHLYPLGHISNKKGEKLHPAIFTNPWWQAAWPVSPQLPQLWGGGNFSHTSQALRNAPGDITCRHVNPPRHPARACWTRALCQVPTRQSACTGHLTPPRPMTEHSEKQRSDQDVGTPSA